MSQIIVFRNISNAFQHVNIEGKRQRVAPGGLVEAPSNSAVNRSRSFIRTNIAAAGTEPEVKTVVPEKTAVPVEVVVPAEDVTPVQVTATEADAETVSEETPAEDSPTEETPEETVTADEPEFPKMKGRGIYELSDGSIVHVNKPEAIKLEAELQEAAED